MSDYQISPFSEDAMPQKISPEGAKIANTYLANACSLKDSSRILNMQTQDVSSTIKQPLIKEYINSILRETGFRHMTKIAEKLDDLVDLKWQELKEADIGSNKDIADLLSMAHRMRLDMSRLLQADLPKDDPKNQTNTQVNVYGPGSYGKLMEKLIQG